MKKRFFALIAFLLAAASVTFCVSAEESDQTLSIERPYAEMLLNLCTAIREKDYGSIDRYLPDDVSADDTIREDAGEYLNTKWLDGGQGGSDLNETLFALTDLNGDGISELALTGQSGNLDLFCVVEEGETKILGTYAYRNTARICGNYVVAESAGPGEDNVFVAMAVSDRELQVVDGVIKQTDEDDKIHYLKPDETEITESQARSIREKYLRPEEPLWMRLLDYEASFRAAVERPMIRSVQNVFGGVKISWEEFGDAPKYRVLRKARGETEWSSLGDTSETSFLDRDASSGEEYAYTVCTVSTGESGSASAFDPIGMKIVYVAAPKLLEAVGVPGGIEVRWEKSEGAFNYRVFRMTEGEEKWQSLGDTNAAFCSDSDVKDGKRYVYTVRAVSEDGSDYLSSYDPQGIAIRYQKTEQGEEGPAESAASEETSTLPSSLPEENASNPVLYRVLIGFGIFAAIAAAVFLTGLFRKKR